MEFLLALALSAGVSLAVLPTLKTLAPRLGLIDKPDPRKVHSTPIPRVGGWGIAFGALAVVAIWAPNDPLVTSYLAGAIILFAFGAWDDRHELGHYAKFLGQIAAIVPILSWGGLYVTNIPFIDTPLPAAVGIPFTAFALMGMINATNHSDGLDGLAGGETLASLGAIAFLSWLAGGTTTVLIALAAIGSVIGFMRHNHHPARLFMGDSGSQLLGYTLGVTAIMLTQRDAPDLSPAVVLLLLGLPIADILMVFYKRISGGMNWFRATKNHVHHRLLDLGFHHGDAVLLITTVHILLVGSGLALRVSPDWLIIFVYLGITGTLFAGLFLAERKQARVDGPIFPPLSDTGSVTRRLLVVTPRQLISLILPFYLVGAAAWSGEVSREFGAVAFALFWLLILFGAFGNSNRAILRRASTYAAMALVAYHETRHWPFDASWAEPAEWALFAVLGISVAVAVWFSPRRREFEFRFTTVDFLIAFLSLLAFSVVVATPEGWIALFVVKLALLIYAGELVMIERREKWHGLTVAVLVSSGILAVSGILT